MRVPAHLLHGSAAPTPRRTGLLHHLDAVSQNAIATAPTATPAPPTRARHSAPVKKLLVAVMLLATVGTLAGGTLATFNAQTANPSNTFSTGTLVLANTLNAGTVCYSAGASSGTISNNNVNGSCDSAAFASTAKPGDSATAKVILKNSGDLAAATLKLYTAACTNANNTETWHGAGNPCSALYFYVEEDDSTWTAKSCLYGTASGSSCIFQDPGSSTISNFQASHSSSATALVIPNGLAAGASRYFKIGLMLPSAADNSYQGRQATFDLTWYLNQT